MWTIKWHQYQWPWMTWKITFAVWNLSNSFSSGNVSRINYGMFTRESAANMACNLISTVLYKRRTSEGHRLSYIHGKSGSSSSNTLCLKNGHHPTTNDKFNNSCPIPVIFGTNISKYAIKSGLICPSPVYCTYLTMGNFKSLKITSSAVNEHLFWEETKLLIFYLSITCASHTRSQ